MFTEAYPIHLPKNGLMLKLCIVFTEKLKRVVTGYVNYEGVQLVIYKMEFKEFLEYSETVISTSLPYSRTNVRSLENEGSSNKAIYRNLIRISAWVE